MIFTRHFLLLTERSLTRMDNISETSIQKSDNISVKLESALRNIHSDFCSAEQFFRLFSFPDSHAANRIGAIPFRLLSSALICGTEPGSMSIRMPLVRESDSLRSRSASALPNLLFHRQTARVHSAAARILLSGEAFSVFHNSRKDDRTCTFMRSDEHPGLSEDFPGHLRYSL